MNHKKKAEDIVADFQGDSTGLVIAVETALRQTEIEALEKAVKVAEDENCDQTEYGCDLYGAYERGQAMTQDRTAIRDEIFDKRRQIETLEAEINQIAKAYIKDLHFLDYKVSTFWACDDSPIGVCLFKLDDYCQPTYCRYCNGPVERK